MALTTPILYTQVAFDASKDQAFKFNVIGGDQVTGATIVIKDSATLAEVYTKTSLGFSYVITVPGGSLTNGKSYQAYVTTQNLLGETSPQSNSIQFYCYSSPTFVFSNMPTTHIINSASFTFSVTYNQSEGEKLNLYKFDLYDDTGILLSTSSTKYVGPSSVPVTVSYTFSGFEDRTTYKIQVTGATVNGTLLDTGVIDIFIRFESVVEYGNLYLTNNCEDGNITIDSHVLAIDGKSNPENPIYIDGKEIDLRVDGSYVLWDEGYRLPNNYTMKIWGKGFKINTSVVGKLYNIVELTNVNNDIVSVSYWENNTKAWYEMRVQNSNAMWAYVVKSEQIYKPTESDYLFIWIRCDGGLYDLKINNLGSKWNGG